MKKLFLIFPVIFLSGCASIVAGGPDTLNLITSDGSRAQAQMISAQGVQTLYLPTMVSVKKSCKDITIQVIEDKKIAQTSMIVNSSIEPWVFGNIVFGGIIGLGIDALAGNICTYDNNNVIIPIIKK